MQRTSEQLVYDGKLFIYLVNEISYVHLVELPNTQNAY